MAPTPVFWHKRYEQQARWTASLRDQAYHAADLHAAQRILEVGCGTGVILAELAAFQGLSRWGVDIDTAALRFARRADPKAALIGADGNRLPCADDSFDTAICHFLLLWVDAPEEVIREMARVTRPGGWILCLAEPDYGGRIDHPPPLDELGRLQTQALREQGAEPEIGRRLPGLLTSLGLVDVRTGILGADGLAPADRRPASTEWPTLGSDLGDRLSSESLDTFQQLDRAAWEDGSRVLFVPTFFAYGRKPAPRT